MATIDLTTPPTPPEFALDGLPRRVTLSLTELQAVAEAAGGAPLPFSVVELAPSATNSGLGGRLGAAPGESEDTAAQNARAALKDPVESLTRRGLLVDGAIDAGLSGAIGLLATPEVALDLDVAAGGLRAHAWHRARAGAVATLATVDGLVFEVAWFGINQWAGELARVAAIPEDVTLATSAVPASMRVPLELADAAGEALRSGRADLLPVLAAQHDGSVFSDGAVLPTAEVPAVVAALHQESQGRLRALVAEPGPGGAADLDGGLVVGVLSWTLLRDGWHAIGSAGGDLVDVRRVQPADLAAELAPVLAEVTG
jgi:hypothetical protein